MSDDRSPAIALWEFASIVDGIAAADAIAKGTPVAHLMTGTTHPGKYVVLVAGDTASVAIATEIVIETGRPVAAHCFLPDVDAAVADAITRDAELPAVAGEAIGVLEASSISVCVDAADAAVKAADVTLSAIRLGDGLGGKAYFVVDGAVGEVDAAIDAAEDRATGSAIASVVIPQLTPDLSEDLKASARFVDRMRQHGDNR
ncbi:MAG: BMC domain-containing protein [Acidimicrobiia bacterium]